MGFIPLPVRGAVDENDAVLHQGLRPHQLVVGSIVDNIDDPGLAGAAFQKEENELKPPGIRKLRKQSAASHTYPKITSLVTRSVLQLPRH